MEARCTGSLTLDVEFGSLDNFRSEELIFNIALFRSVYHALLRRTAFTRFNAIPHYAYLKVEIPGPRGVITVSGNMERSLCTEEYMADLAVEAQNGLFKSNSSLVVKTTDTVRQVR